jgi:hypothetical protein
VGKKKSDKKEKRGFTNHGREFWLSKDQIQKEIGCEPEEVDEIWEGGKRAKAEKPVKPHTSKPEKKTAKLEEKVLAEMKRLAGNGITECTSTLLRDKLGLDKESGRDQIRRLMKKLEEAGKVEIGQKEVGKRKQYVYTLVK